MHDEVIALINFQSPSPTSILDMSRLVEYLRTPKLNTSLIGHPQEATTVLHPTHVPSNLFISTSILNLDSIEPLVPCPPD